MWFHRVLKINMASPSSPTEEANLPSPEEEPTSITTTTARFTQRIQSPEPFLSVDSCLPYADEATATVESQPLKSSDSEESEVCDVSSL